MHIGRTALQLDSWQCLAFFGIRSRLVLGGIKLVHICADGTHVDSGFVFILSAVYEAKISSVEKLSDVTAVLIYVAADCLLGFIYWIKLHADNWSKKSVLPFWWIQSKKKTPKQVCNQACLKEWPEKERALFFPSRANSEHEPSVHVSAPTLVYEQWRAKTKV